MSAMSPVSSRPEQPPIEIQESEAGLELKLWGDWTIPHLPGLLGALDALRTLGVRSIRLDLSGIRHFDTSGAWLIDSRTARWRQEGINVEMAGLSESQAELLDLVSRYETAPAVQEMRPRLRDMAVRVGQATYLVLYQARDLTAFLGIVIVGLGRALLLPQRVRWAAVVTQMERTGINALPIVGLLTFLIGVVLAYQGADQLAQFGAEIFTVNLVGIAVLREMGILITAIIVAGRSGSAFAAQIGTMTVNEEVDALRTIGLDVVEVLVMPRVIGLVIMMPLLTFYADILGLLGGAVMAAVELDITLVQFTRQLNQAVSISHFWVGMIKAPIFGFVIAMVGCFEGLRTARSAESVGIQTTRAVVESIFLVILLDALFSILYSSLGV